jgi:lipoate-protein ligase A
MNFELNQESKLDRKWRLIHDDAATGSWNMAVDEALWEAVSSGDSVPVLRFYSWEPHCLSLGRLQKTLPPAVVQRENGEREDFEFVRRPTGGRAVWHGNEITYSICIALRDLPEDSRSVNGAYTWLSRGFLRGLQELGLRVELSTGNAKADGPNCFAATAACDFVANGKKLIGAAQGRNEYALMQHGSILLSIDDSKWRDLAGGGMEGATSIEAIVKEQGGKFSDSKWSRKRIIEALHNGFAQEFGILFEKSSKFEAELQRAQQLKSEKYEENLWNYSAKLRSCCN